jgi:hypothetical protein
MKKRFMLAVGQATSEQNDAFRAYVIGAGFNWWHWIPSLWLLIDYRGAWNAEIVRNKATQFFPGATLFVSELSEYGDTWAGFGPSTGDQNMYPWLMENWKK